MRSILLVFPLCFSKCGKIWKNGRFSGRLWPDWVNATWAAMAELGSIGLMTSPQEVF